MIASISAVRSLREMTGSAIGTVSERGVRFDDLMMTIIHKMKVDELRERRQYQDRVNERANEKEERWLE